MKVMGIDQSYTKCAVVVLDDDEVERVEIIKGNKNLKDRIEQAYYITLDIGNICRENKPDYLGIEGLAFGARGNVTRDLAGLQFIIVACMRYLQKYDNKIEVYDPRTIKKFATGSGAAKKEELYQALPNSTKKLFDEMGLKKTTGRDDATDAYWIARYMMEQKNANIQS